MNTRIDSSGDGLRRVCRIVGLLVVLVVLMRTIPLVNTYTHADTLTTRNAQSAIPAVPSGITDATNSGSNADTVTNNATIMVVGTVAGNASVELTAARSGSTPVTGTGTANSGGAYTISLNLATDGMWSITAKQTESGKTTSDASGPLTVTIDTTPPIVTAGVPQGAAAHVEHVDVPEISRAGGLIGVAPHENDLYLVGKDNHWLYTLGLGVGSEVSRVESVESGNDSPDVATQFGSEKYFDVDEKYISGSVSHSGSDTSLKMRPRCLSLPISSPAMPRSASPTLSSSLGEWW